MMLIRRIEKTATGLIAALALVGCSASTGEAGPEFEQAGESADADLDEAQTEIAGTSQALGNFSRFLPKRGTNKRLVETRFLGWGILYSMQLRTGMLVDAVSASFYAPSNADNRYRPGDAVFTRAAGGTAGSPAPALLCPAGFAAQGMYGRAGAHVDMLGLVCTQIGSDGEPIAATQRAIGAYGGTGGTFFYDVCPDSEWLGGLNVQVASKSSGTNNIVGSVQGYCAAAH